MAGFGLLDRQVWLDDTDFKPHVSKASRVVAKTEDTEATSSEFKMIF